MKNAQASATEQTQAAEQERQRGEVLAHQLASARGDLGTLTARVTALTDARSEAEKALQTAQASAAEQKLALEQERERGDALLRQLASREPGAESVQNVSRSAPGCWASCSGDQLLIASWLGLTIHNSVGFIRAHSGWPRILERSTAECRRFGRKRPQCGYVRPGAARCSTWRPGYVSAPRDKRASDCVVGEAR